MSQGRHSRRGGRAGLQAEVGRLRALVARLREESAAASRDLTAERAAAADAAGRVTALRDEVALLRSRLDESAGTVAAHEAESERLRADLVLARGTARYAERAALAEVADLRAQVADLQRRLDDASGLVGSVTRAVAARVAGTIAGPSIDGGATPAGPVPGGPQAAPATDTSLRADLLPAETGPDRPGAEPVGASWSPQTAAVPGVAGSGVVGPAEAATSVAPSGGTPASGGAAMPVRPWVDGRHAAGAAAFRVALVAPLGTDGPSPEQRPGASRPDPDADVVVDVDPRVDPWGRPLPPTGSA